MGIEIVGYTYDGAMYCVECTKKGCPVLTHAHVTPGGEVVKVRVRMLEPCDCDKDENGVCNKACTGWGPHPVFDIDELDGDEHCDSCRRGIR